MKNLLIIILLLVAVKFLLNFLKYLTCKRYFKVYNEHLKNPNFKIEEIKHQIIKIFKDADVLDNYTTVVQPVGYNRISTATGVSMMANIGSLREDVVMGNLAMFHSAIGTYRSRMWESINPVYWFEFVIFLPKNIFHYLGISAESVFIKIGNIIYWIVTVVLYGTFSNEINSYIKPLFK
jgi:hypothetical protein